MKVKEAERTANAAWSPAPLPDLMLAAGTAAQQLDATFSSSARLEIFGLGLGDSTLEMPVLASVETPSRFHCVSWGAHGLSTGSRPAGMIVGGSDGGKIALYDARKLLDGQPALLETTSRHTGAVRSLDFNPFQANLLASGASDSELYIWDLNSPSTPMTPGAKAQPAEDVSAVTWNRQVQHIMASTFTSRCVVWDLRKNEPIIKVGDGQAGMKCKVVAWHPEVATQLVLASEDDHTPAIQLWDLRFATAPLKTLQRHQKGILSLAWCQRDSHLLLSAGKDDKILCWDPHSDAPGGEVVAELSASPQWNFSVEWCPRNPALIAASSFDGHVSVYNVMGKVEEPLASPTSALADSFPDMAGVAAALPTVQRRTSIPLTRPPRWMKRPCGATFGFGGRLVSFCHTPTTDGGRPTRQVEIHQVVTEPELVQRSQAFQQVLMTDGLPGFCTERAESAAEPDRPVWRFLAARFSSDPRGELLRLLGYQSRPENGGEGENGGDDQAMQEPPAEESGEDAFEAISRSQTTTSDSPTAEPEELFDIPAGDDTDGQVSQAILRGDMTEAVERCLQSERTADALIIAMATSQELYESTRAKYLESMKTDLSRLISALVSRDWSTVVGRCDPGSWREALVAVLTHAPPEQVAPLCEALGARLELQHTEAMWTSALLCYVCAGSVDRLVQCWERTRPDATSPHALQDLMEQAMTLFRANQLAGTATALTSGGMQDKLLRYAQLLTSQGSLETALGYLGDCTDPAAVSLCERVQHCLTPAPAVGAGQYQRQTASAARFPAAPAAAPAANRGYQMHSGQPSPGLPSARDSRMSSYSQQPAQPHQTQTGGFQQPGAFQQPAGTFQQPAGAFQPPVAPVAPLVPTPAAQPTAPPSGGTGSGYRLGGRRQYAADPSLAGSAGGYGMTGQGYGSMAPVSSAPYGQMAAPTAAATVFTPSFSEPQPYPAPSQPAVQPFVPTPAAAAGTDYGTGAGAAPPPAAAAGAGPIITAVSSGPGWNDPPPLRRSSKKTTTSTTSVLQTVTQPIYNPAEMAAAAAAQPPPGQHYPMAGMYQPAPSGQFSPYQSIAAAQQQQPPAAAPTPPPPAPQEPPPPKGPVPPEHAPLQDTLERLRETCAAAATTAQARRRLEEVSRRLEVLYDMLRASSLSAGTIQGLHQLIGWLQCSDWASAQQQLNALVAASNMAEIAGFMPGIKSLLQIAAQMQVRI